MVEIANQITNTAIKEIFSLIKINENCKINKIAENNLNNLNIEINSCVSRR